MLYDPGSLNGSLSETCQMRLEAPDSSSSLAQGGGTGPSRREERHSFLKNTSIAADQPSPI